MKYTKHFDVFGEEAKEVPCHRISGPPDDNTPGSVGALVIDTTSPNGVIYKCIGKNNLGRWIWKLITDEYIVPVTFRSDGKLVDANQAFSHWDWICQAVEYDGLRVICQHTESGDITEYFLSYISDQKKFAIFTSSSDEGGSTGKVKYLKINSDGYGTVHEYDISGGSNPLPVNVVVQRINDNLVVDSVDMSNEGISQAFTDGRSISVMVDDVYNGVDYLTTNVEIVDNCVYIRVAISEYKNWIIFSDGLSSWYIKEEINICESLTQEESKKAMSILRAEPRSYSFNITLCEKKEGYSISISNNKSWNELLARWEEGVKINVTAVFTDGNGHKLYTVKCPLIEFSSEESRFRFAFRDEVLGYNEIILRPGRTGLVDVQFSGVTGCSIDRVVLDSENQKAYILVSDESVLILWGNEFKNLTGNSGLIIHALVSAEMLGLDSHLYYSNELMITNIVSASESGLVPSDTPGVIIECEAIYQFRDCSIKNTDSFHNRSYCWVTEAIIDRTDPFFGVQECRRLKGPLILGIANYFSEDGFLTKANGFASSSRGFNTVASGAMADAQGKDSRALGVASHAEGEKTAAYGHKSHTEGTNTKALGENAHAEGLDGEASGDWSHKEGDDCYAEGIASHAEGAETIARGPHAHSEGYKTEALHGNTHTEGAGTRTGADNQHVQGTWNEVKGEDFLHVVGNGSSEDNRSNAHTLDKFGNAWYAGDVASRGVSLQGLNARAIELEKSSGHFLGTLYNFSAMTERQALSEWSVTNEDANNWSFVEGEGLKIKSQGNGIYGGNSDCKNVFILPTSGSFLVEVKVTMDRIPSENWQQFALLAITDQDNYVKMKYGFDNELGWQILAEKDGVPGVNHGAGIKWEPTTVWMRLKRVGSIYTGYCSTDGIAFRQIGEPITVEGLDVTHIGFAAFNDGGADSQIEFTVNYVQVETSGGITQLISRLSALESILSCTAADEGKVLKIVNGIPTWVSLINAEEVEF